VIETEYAKELFKKLILRKAKNTGHTRKRKGGGEKLTR